MTFKVISSNYMINKPGKGEFLDILLRSAKTIFSTKDAALLWGEESEDVISARLYKYAKTGKLVRVRRGFYAKDNTYNRFELAARIYTPSYVSFETVLTRTGINFQYYATIFIASAVNREIVIDGQTISYVHMKDVVLSNIEGIERVDGVATATKERAFLDRIYVSKEYHFDNLDALDWSYVFKLLPMYRSKRTEKKVKEYFDYYNSSR